MWIIVAIIAYFLLALVVVLDKYLLAGPLPNPKLYAFAIGIFGGLAFLLIPFGFLEVPVWPIIVLGILAGVIQIFAILALFSGLKKFEASRIIPAIGGLLPVFTLLFTISVGRAILESFDIFAFVFLVLGSVVVSFERRKLFTFQSLTYAFVVSLFFALFVVLSKFVYEAQPFLSGLLWIVVGSFSAALSLLVSGELRKEIRNVLRKKGAVKKALSPAVFLLFVGNQALGALGFVLQNWAVALVPFAYISFVNALEGMKYVFVVVLVSIISLRFPRLIRERVNRGAIVQKLLAIVSIGIGLALLAL
ncbi:MAG TPA: hypothetical protein VJC15_00465 [Candidatus Paceibacterota bacterium]